MNRKDMIEHIRQQDMEIFDLIAKVIEVIKDNNLWVDERYTFNNGEVWTVFDPVGSQAINVHKLEEIDNE